MNKNNSLPILIAGAMIALAVFFGLKSSAPQVAAPGQPTPAVAGEKAPAVPAQVTVSIDDDAILGNRTTAQVAIVEFSDYECSFCKRFRDDTLDQIKESYLDTGKAIFVYRDLPLDFHNPAAKTEAMAAECAKDQGGDQAFYQFHDGIYEKTPGNGQGLSSAQLSSLASEIDLDGAELTDCVESEKFADEVAQDAADAAKASINGTPGFVIGKLDSEGVVTGEVLSGAQPFSAFQAVVDQYLE